MNQPIPENSHRQQPIPRSFFKDGQRAKYADRLGAIAVRAKEVMFIPLEQDGHEYTLLLGVLDTHFKWNNLELLDRTIDQVMEGDEISNVRETWQVIGRCGDAVALCNKHHGMAWMQLDMLKECNYTIVQPNPEVMTDETAKALREEAMKKVFTPKNGETYLYWDFRDHCIYTTEWITHNVDIASYYTANIHKTREDAEYYGKHHAPAFLHVFKE